MVCAPNKRSTGMAGRLVRYAWASPATALGLGLSLLAALFGARLRVVNGVIEVAGGRVRELVVRLPKALRFSAITFGHVILGLDHATLGAVRAHEHVHVRQYERWGVLFFALYLASSLWQMIRGRHPYFDNCFEREAFRESDTD